MALILDGKKVQDEIAEKLAEQIVKSSALNNYPPRLAILQVGNNPASTVYVEQKKKFGEKIGAQVELFKFEEKIEPAEIARQIDKLNQDPKVHGIILQLPLPENLNKDELLEKISPEKDVDGLTALNIKKMWAGDKSGFVPATAKAILTLLDHYRVPITGQRVVVIGRSALVGRPTALALSTLGATVTVCHRGTTDLASHTKLANLIVVATGQPKLLRAEHLTPGAGQTIVDVGITRTEEALSGDTDFENIKNLVGAISPVPGGVGPLTVASLFMNLLEAYKKV